MEKYVTWHHLSTFWGHLSMSGFMPIRHRGKQPTLLKPIHNLLGFKAKRWHASIMAVHFASFNVNSFISRAESGVTTGSFMVMAQNLVVVSTTRRFCLASHKANKRNLSLREKKYTCNAWDWLASIELRFMEAILPSHTLSIIPWVLDTGHVI